MKELGKIAKILTAGLKPVYRHLHINIRTAYSMGTSWGGDAVARVSFHDAMKQAFSENGWFVREPSSSCGSLTARLFGQYLYLHPMQITGYILPERLDEVLDILNLIDDSILLNYEVSNHEACTYGVYDVSDSEIVSLFTKHKEKIWDAIIEAADAHPDVSIEGLVFDYLLKETVFPRNNESSVGVLSSDQIENLMLLNEAVTLCLMCKIPTKP